MTNLRSDEAAPGGIDPPRQEGARGGERRADDDPPPAIEESAPVGLSAPEAELPAIDGRPAGDGTTTPVALTPSREPEHSEEPEAGPLIPRSVRHLLVAWVGAFIVIGGTWRLFAAQDLVFAFASLGGSAVILFGMPASPMAQPRSLFGGHAIASMVGLLFLGWFGTNTWSIAAAMATALVAMQVTRTIHSPAGADPIIIMTSAVSGPMVMLNLSVGLALLWLVAVLLLNALGVHPYCRDAHLRLLRLAASSARRVRDALRRPPARR